MLRDRLEGIVANGEKVLVFTQFREMGGLLGRFIEERREQRPLFYCGGCSVRQRRETAERFITKDTFEERINDMIRQKKHLADMTAASGESRIGKLSNKELRDIFG